MDLPLLWLLVPILFAALGFALMRIARRRMGPQPRAATVASASGGDTGTSASCDGGSAVPASAWSGEGGRCGGAGASGDWGDGGGSGDGGGGGGD